MFLSLSIRFGRALSVTLLFVSNQSYEFIEIHPTPEDKFFVRLFCPTISHGRHGCVPLHKSLQRKSLSIQAINHTCINNNYSIATFTLRGTQLMSQPISREIVNMTLTINGSWDYVRRSKNDVKRILLLSIRLPICPGIVLLMFILFISSAFKSQYLCRHHIIVARSSPSTGVQLCNHPSNAVDKRNRLLWKIVNQ